MKKLEVGQTIYSLNVGNAARRVEQVLTEYVITKVGRVYFWIKHKEHGYDKGQFYIDGMSEKTEYLSDHELFLTKEEYYELKKRNELLDIVFEYFSRIGKKPNIKTDDLQKIVDIIDQA